MDAWKSFCNFLDSLGPFANLASIISFFISLVTLILAGGIRHAILKANEKKDFRERAQSYVDVLRSYRSIYNKDSEVINDQYYRNISATLSEILAEFRHVLPLGYKHRIKSLNRLIKRQLNKKKRRSNFGPLCVEKMGIIASDLRREKDIL